MKTYCVTQRGNRSEVTPSLRSYILVFILFCWLTSIYLPFPMSFHDQHLGCWFKITNGRSRHVGQSRRSLDLQGMLGHCGSEPTWWLSAFLDNTCTFDFPRDETCRPFCLLHSSPNPAILVEPGLQKGQQPEVGSGVLILCLNQNWFQREILVIWKTVPPHTCKNSSWNCSKINNMANNVLVSWAPCCFFGHMQVLYPFSLQSRTLHWNAPHLSWGMKLFLTFCFSGVSISHEPESVLSLSLLQGCPYWGLP